MSNGKPTAEQLRERRTAWVAALRSDEFEQGECALNTKISPEAPSSYCCLGVGCEVAMRMGLQLKTMQTDSGDVKYDDNVAYMPARAMEWYGLRTEMGEASDGESLVDLNDNPTPFAQIADFIESNPTGLWDDDAEAMA